MNDIWKELSEESRQKVRDMYDQVCWNTKDSIIDLGRCDALKELFGEENLESVGPTIRTWKDYLESIKDEQAQSLTGGIDKVSLDSGYVNRDFPVFKKAVATFKIAKLIELGYGGIITNEEWKDGIKQKYIIRLYNSTLRTDTSFFIRHFLAFHTEKQRNEFMKYNEQLIKDYYML